MLFLEQANIVEDAMDSLQFYCQQTVIQTKHTLTQYTNVINKASIFKHTHFSYLQCMSNLLST